MIRAQSPKTIFNVLVNSVYPEFYGAAGDGVTNDTTAFDRAGATGKPLQLNPLKTYCIKEWNPPSTCPGLFSLGGRATITNCSDSISTNDLISVTTDTFAVEGISFIMPISTDPLVAPAARVAVIFDTAAAHADHRVVNCKLVGGAGLAYFNSLAGDSYVYCSGNVVTSCHNEAIMCPNPQVAIFTDNEISDCVYGGSAPGGALRVGSSAQTTQAECVIISDNIFRRCCPNISQEAVDCTGIIRSMQVNDNIVDSCGNGGFELKTFTPAFSPYAYADHQVCGNTIILKDGDTGSVGIALNLSGTPPAAGTPARLKIAGNHISTATMAATGNGVYGVIVTGYTDVDVTGNTIKNVNQGVLLNPVGVDDLTLLRINITGNNIYASDAAIANSGGALTTVQDLLIAHNTLIATVLRAITFASCVVNNAKILHNYIESQASYGLELRDTHDSVVAFNDIVAALDGTICQGTACSDIEFYKNRVTTTAGFAFNVATGTGIVILDNRANVPLIYRTVTGAGTYVAAGNVRGIVAADPSATAGGAIGDIYRNSAPAAAGVLQWICTTAGDAGAAVYKPVAIAA
jgi:hypothetical protein